MTAKEILDEYDKWAPTRAYSYNSDHEAFAHFVADVLIPRERRALEIAAELSGGRWTTEAYLIAAKREKDL